jgi:hypothetical protein
MCLPAWRIIQTGIRSTDSPRAARNSKGSGEIDGAPVAYDNSDNAESPNNGNDIREYIIVQQNQDWYRCGYFPCETTIGLLKMMDYYFFIGLRLIDFDFDVDVVRY